MSNEENQTPEQGTEVDETTNQTEETTEEAQATEDAPVEGDASPEIDYKKKFSESTREAQRLLDETRQEREKREALEAELEKYKNDGKDYDGKSDEIEEFFSDYSDEEKERVMKFADGVTKKALDTIYKDPAISSAKTFHNESIWDDAFSKATQDYPELKDAKAEFKSKYFKPNKDVPSNIDDLMKDMAKIYLYDKAKDLGRMEAQAESKRIDIERSGGGDKETNRTTRSLEDWNRLAQENPAKFAKLSKEFNSDMESGKLH